MSNQYIYSGDQAIIIQDGTIIWNDQSHEQSSLQYFDANDSVLNDSTINESYVTAIGSNETQYLSILEHSDANEDTLEDLHNLTIENRNASNGSPSNSESSKIPTKVEEENNDEDGGAEVIVFTMDGSDDLYGIQLTQDEEGKVQKYQFKFRTTPDGQLEPIPETVTLLSNEDETLQIEESIPTQNEQIEETEQSQAQYFLVQTPLQSENSGKENTQNEEQGDGLSLKHVYIKGDPEEVAEKEQVNAESFDHCVNGISQDTHLERHLGKLCIKTEMVDAENIPISSSNMVEIKQESYEREFEEDDFDQTFQNEISNDEHLGTIDQEIYPDNEIQIYQHESEENNEEQFLAGVEDHDQLIQQDHDQLIQHFMDENSQIEVQYETELEESESREEESQDAEVYDSPEIITDDVVDYLNQASSNVNDVSETGQYQITENYSGEALDDQEVPVPSIATRVVDSYQPHSVHRSNILKHALTENEDKTRKPLVSVNYYVVYPEKENVNSLGGHETAHSHLPVPKLKTNPRSVLRNSSIKHRDKRQKLATNVLPACDLYHKRFAKNKDAMRAKHFHNFLNRTTIPHAPIRQQRQPRKQEIKPVIERSDEEIIVQQVIVSSNGFIESFNKKVKNKKVQVTAVVELSDSEDDRGLKVKQNRRKTHHLPRNCSESELSIIEIQSDNEESDIYERTFVSKATNIFQKNINRISPSTLKRRRGRPPKNRKSYFELPAPNVELLPSKRNCTEHATLVSTCDNIVSITSATLIDKPEITCPFCPKTFPSQNSLNTHIIHHNLENSLKNKPKMNSRQSFLPRQSLLPKIEYNHRCDECHETFKNTILLQKHVCTKKQTSLGCSVCLKQFRDITLLNIHKKSHAKSNLVKNTSVVKISPKKSLHRPSMSLMRSSVAKSPKKLLTKVFKCTECPKVCDSEERLTTHIKMHKKFLCSSCFGLFSSKLLLDTHVRINCVKTKVSNNKRLSFTIKKSFIHTPPRRVSVAKQPEKSLNNTMNQSVMSVKMDCDKCKMKFSTFRNLYTHKVQKHGLNTPDKSLMTKPKQGIYKAKAAHGGIPANDRMKKAYAALRKKLAETEDLII